MYIRNMRNYLVLEMNDFDNDKKNVGRVYIIFAKFLYVQGFTKQLLYIYICMYSM